MNEASGTLATCFGWWIYDSFGRRILGNARKFSIVGLYSICEGGLVDVLGEAGGLGWTWRWSSAKLGSRQVLALKLFGMELRTIGFAELRTLIKCKNQS